MADLIKWGLFAIILFLMATNLVLFGLVLQFLNPSLPVEMKPSPVHGRGMFAKIRIKAGKVIETAPLIFIKRERDLTDDSIVRRYDLRLEGENSAIMLGYGSIYNHSDYNNAIWYYQGDLLFVEAVRDINPGEEVFVNYGPTYWIGKDGQKK